MAIPKDVYVRGSSPVVSALFQVLRCNGIEASVPFEAVDGYCYLICLQSAIFDCLICSWKDRIAMTSDPARWPRNSELDY
jgi:hypothetical protein